MKSFKKNQIVIYTFALMLVAAGYLNYTSKVNKDSLETANQETYVSENETSDIGDAKLVNSNDVVDENDKTNENVEERAATLYSSMLLRHGVDIKYIIKTAKKVNENISSFSSAMCRVLSKYLSNEEVKGETCPQCGGKIIREGGCKHCDSCDYSACQ